MFTHSAGGFVEHDGARLYYETVGDPAGKPLVLLHGGLGSLVDFNPVLEQLPAGFRRIGIDLRGHGRSTTGKRPLSYAQYQADVEAVLNHLGVRRCFLLGFSDGGIVGYRLAAQRPELIEKLATLGAQWRLSKTDPAYEMLAGLTVDMWNEMFPEAMPYYAKINPEPDYAGLVRAAVGVWTDLGDAGYPGPRVSAIRCPLLIMRGDQDMLFSLSEAAALQGQVQGAGFLNIAYAGHEAHLEAPAVFSAAVNAFLTQEPTKP